MACEKGGGGWSAEGGVLRWVKEMEMLENMKTGRPRKTWRYAVRLGDKRR